jgi:hypothetical protein
LSERVSDSGTAAIAKAGSSRIAETEGAIYGISILR